MIKNICTLLVLFFTIITYSQNIMLVKNTNPKAKELKHSLNSTRDSLILSCDIKILKVEIFNEDYEKTIIVEDFKTQINLKDIPEGKFVVEARLLDKIIVIDLMKYDFINEFSNSSISSMGKEIAEGKGMMLDESLKVITKSPNKSIESILTGTKPKKQISKNHKFYWVITQINNESGSSKTMKLVDQESVDRMISQHKAVYSSISGSLNDLTVWEVYNTSKFMRFQMLNPDYIYSVSSDLFNTTPYYTKHNIALNY